MFPEKKHLGNFDTQTYKLYVNRIDRHLKTVSFLVGRSVCSMGHQAWRFIMCTRLEVKCCDLNYNPAKIKLLTLRTTFCLVFFCSATSFAAVENLDEVAVRKSRHATANWGYSLLENASNNYTWQPETLNYSDVTTGNEVWRLTYTPAGVGGVTQDYGITHWNANGNRLLLRSKRATGAFTADGTFHIWMLTNSDGSRLKPAKGSPSQWAEGNAYPLWSTVIPERFYFPATNDSQGLVFNTLYKATASDTTITRSTAITFPLVSGSINIKKAMSGDGRKVRLVYGGKTYPATVYPEANTSLDILNGSANIPNYDWYWGTASGVTSYHDQYMTGAVNGIDGVWSLLMPATAANDGPYWKVKLTGSATDGGPLHISDQTVPYDWGGEIEPVNTVGDFKTKPTPWCTDGSLTPNNGTGAICMDNLQHGSMDRWGRYMVASLSPISVHEPHAGYALLDTHNHAVSTLYDSSLLSGAGILNIRKIGHPDWQAWSDWNIGDGSIDGISVGVNGTYHNFAQNYKDVASQKKISFVHRSFNGGTTTAAAYLGTIQSPDGTKNTFVSDYQNATDGVLQTYWSVIYYPYPPEIKSAAKNGSNLRLTWDFNQGANCSSDAGTTPRTGPTPNFSTPRTYATRGWPHETLDCPPSPREIKQFRVWTSADNITWTPAGTTSYNNCNGTNECGMWAETAWTYDYTQANSTTRYYAVTSLEHSGLESRILSNIWKVSIDANGNITHQIQQSGYPANPGGKSSFYTSYPSSVTALFTHKQAPATANGQYVVKWNAPVNASMIRFYNIYAKDGSFPFTNDTSLADRQKSRIASIPASSDYSGTGAFSYIDWLGAIDGSTKYIVTAVDYQGNETLNVGAPDIVKDFEKALP